MDERKLFRKNLDELAAELRELEVAYERYFSGEEKREPLKQRSALERKLRKLSLRRIIRTDDRFKFETLSGRYHTYATHWNRIQRLIDEGRYQRHLSRSQTPDTPAKSLRPDTGNDKLYHELLRAHQDCALGSSPRPYPVQHLFGAPEGADPTTLRQAGGGIQCRGGKRQTQAAGQGQKLSRACVTPHRAASADIWPVPR